MNIGGFKVKLGTTTVTNVILNTAIILEKDTKSIE